MTEDHNIKALSNLGMRIDWTAHQAWFFDPNETPELQDKNIRYTFAEIRRCAEGDSSFWDESRDLIDKTRVLLINTN